MKESKRHNYRLVAIAIATIASGLLIWTQNTRQINFTDPVFLSTWIFIGTVAAFIAQFVVNLKMRDMIGSFTIGYVIAVVLHFIAGVLITNYVQARFEISLFVSLLSGAAAGWLGSLIWIVLKRSGQKK